MIYTTNPVEALHRIIRKIVKGKAAWVSETALLKQIYLSLMHNENLGGEQRIIGNQYKEKSCIYIQK
ncbi:MAG: hypothetical protein R2774_11465 [Saprospiraceae bacterium]